MLSAYPYKLTLQLPLTAVASIYGMNAKEFGQGNVHLVHIFRIMCKQSLCHPIALLLPRLLDNQISPRLRRRRPWYPVPSLSHTGPSNPGADVRCSLGIHNAEVTASTTLLD